MLHSRGAALWARGQGRCSTLKLLLVLHRHVDDIPLRAPPLVPAGVAIVSVRIHIMLHQPRMYEWGAIYFLR
eukprot:7721682-Pyramimonas_sp.AAC.1